MDLSQRLDEMELAIHKPSFRKGTGRANEVNYWVFDYPPEMELEVQIIPVQEAALEPQMVLLELLQAVQETELAAP